MRPVPAAVRDVVARAFADLGRIDVIVNNAGYGLFGAAEELSDQQILDQINTNLVGPIQVTRAVLPHLREQGGGRIIQLSTYGGQATNPGASLYNASKFGVEGFMESLAVRERFAPGPPRDPSRRRLEVEQALQVAHVDFRFTSGLREIGSSSDTERSISP